MLDKHSKFAILIIISGFIARLINIKQPILEVAMWRQCETASITRNFYYNGMNIFYPQVLWGGATEGYIGETEFHLYPFVIAILYKLFGVHEYMGRLVSIIAFCGGAFFLYKLSRKYTDEMTAIIALLFYTFNPYIFFYSRSFQPESTMLFFSIAMLYFFSEWIDREGWWRFTLMTLCATLAFLTKIPTICLGLPLLYLCLRKYKINFIIQWRLWLFAIISLVPIILWCKHSSYLKSINGLSWSNFYLSSYSTYLDPHFYMRVFFTEIFEKDLIYVGGVFLVLGIIFTFKEKEFRFIHYWLLAIIAFFFIGAEKTAHHTYYTIPIVAPASILIGYAISNTIKLINTYKITGIKKIVLLLLFIFLIASLPMISYHKITGRYKTKRLEKDYPIYNVGKIVDEVIPKNDLIIGCLWGGPEILYYSNRRGWFMVAHGCSSEAIETLRQKGANYFVTTAQEEIDSSVLDYLKDKYKIIRATDEYLIVHLENSTSS
ncbi:MAG: ArnT family glycosyltransferase [Candidatus Scalinduaceae bacterium]